MLQVVAALIPAAFWAAAAQTAADKGNLIGLYACLIMSSIFIAAAIICEAIRRLRAGLSPPAITITTNPPPRADDGRR